MPCVAPTCAKRRDEERKPLVCRALKIPTRRSCFVEGKVAGVGAQTGVVLSLCLAARLLVEVRAAVARGEDASWPRFVSKDPVQRLFPCPEDV